MANHKNNNLTYFLLVIAGILLLLIPFFLFDVGSALNGTSHLTRFGLHLLAFTGALVAGSLVSSGLSSSAVATTATVKTAAVATALVAVTAVTYNAVQYTSSEKKIVLHKLAPVADSAVALVDSLTGDSLVKGNESLANMEGSFAVKEEIPENVQLEDITIKETPVSASGNDLKNTIDQNTFNTVKRTEENKTQSNDKTTTANTLAEVCNSFQILHGTQQLDRKLGLSIFDPNKTIRFQNDCGCILKDAAMSISRGNNVLEQKTQNGNFINLHTFKDLQADDRLSVEIRQANCKDSKGISFLYTFPKPILSIVLISDHREFETAAELKNKKTAKETTNTPAKTFQKDKVEEEVNKYGN